MYLSTFFLLVWFTFTAKIQACSFDCGELDACISPDGVEADCKDWRRPHERSSHTCNDSAGQEDQRTHISRKILGMRKI